MARYDYGLRGPRDTTEPRFSLYRKVPYGRDFQPPYDTSYFGNRATARYNSDYVRPEGERYPVNPFPYGGDRYGRVAGEAAYRQPYVTRGGTRTYRGSPPPSAYAQRDFAPPYRGRYGEWL